jgi:hypothetical protein
MAKIVLKDLPRDVKVSQEELKRIKGGGLWSWWYHAVTDWQDSEPYDKDSCTSFCGQSGTAGVRG